MRRKIREIPSNLGDRAAKFIEKENLIKANADFQGFTDVIEYFIEQYPDIDDDTNENIQGEVQMPSSSN